MAQVVAAVIGAAFVIGLQVDRDPFLRDDVARSPCCNRILCWRWRPDVGSVVWWPARAALGEAIPLAAVLATSFALLAAAVVFVAPRFGEYAIAAAGVGNASIGPFAQVREAFRKRLSPRGALRRKEWMLLRRDPWLMSQTLMQMLYLVPPALDAVAWLRPGASALPLVVPVLVMAAGQLAGGLAWLAISGEDAPDLVATAPVPPRISSCGPRSRRCSVRLPHFCPLVRRFCALASPWCGLIAAGGIVIAAAAATAVQFWFRSQAKRSQFRRRQVSSRLATFAEAFSSIGWAAIGRGRPASSGGSPSRRRYSRCWCSAAPG